MPKVKISFADYKNDIAEWGLYLLIIFPILAAGGFHWWVSSVFAFLTALTLIAAMLFREHKLHRTGFFFYLGLFYLLLLGVQLLPMPMGLLEFISPASAEWQKVAFSEHRAAGDYPFRPLTLAPARTLYEFAKGIALLAFFFLAMNIFSRKKRPQRPLILLAAIGATSFWIGIFHTLANSESVLGLIELTEAKPYYFMSTFINANNQAALYGAAGFVSLGLLASRQYWGTAKNFLILSTVFSFIGLFLTLSRSGMLNFFPAILLFLILIYRKKTGSARTIVLAGVVALTAVGSLYLAMSEILTEWLSMLPWNEEKDFTKFFLYSTSAAIIPDYIAFGVGKGAFPAVFPQYLTKDFHIEALALWVENQPIQALVDFGPFFGFLLIVLIVGGIVWHIAKIDALNSTDIGVVTALVFLGLHSFNDFNLDVLGITVIFLLLLAHIVRRYYYVQEFRGTPVRYVALIALLVGLLFSAITIGYNRNNDIQDVRKRLYSLARAKTTTEQEFNKAFYAARNSYPADYLIYNYAAAYGLQHTRSESFKQVLRNVNRSFYSAPGIWHTRLLSANYFLITGNIKQALIEYEIAYKNPLNDRGKRNILSALLKNSGKPEYLKEIAGTDIEDINLVVAALMNSGIPQKALEFWSELPNSQIEANEEALRLGAALYYGQRRFEEALSLIERGLIRFPTNANLHVYKGRIALAMNDPEGAERIAKFLVNSPETMTDGAISFAAEVYMRLGKTEEITRLINDFGHRRTILHTLYYFRGLSLNNAGELMAAMNDFRRAKVLNSKYTQPSYVMAGIYEKHERYDLAVLEYKDILKNSPSDKRATEKLEQLNDKLKERSQKIMKKFYLDNRP